jgi:hypothetical protein
MARLQRGRRAIGVEHFVQLVSIPHARDERPVFEHFYRWPNERKSIESDAAKLIILSCGFGLEPPEGQSNLIHLPDTTLGSAVFLLWVGVEAAWMTVEHDASRERGSLRLNNSWALHGV